MNLADDLTRLVSFEDVQSYQRKGSMMTPTLFADVLALHEAQIYLERQVPYFPAR
ncbi:MAG: hypothetical protein L0Z50_23755 [Verrucomicrobiales bacterium]|nr:hypothetical protein [Verrucomicrobiales bacterium]